MNFSVRVSGSVAGLAARIQAAVRAGRRSDEDPAVVVGLPSTSNLRDPAEIAALSRFGESANEET